MWNKTGIVVLFAVGMLSANAGSLVNKKLPPFKQKMAEIALPDEHRLAEAGRGPSQLNAPPARVMGTYTGIQGYFDYQCNAGACQYIRVDPSDAGGHLIHVIFMEASDSTAPTGTTRGTYYAYSTDAGATWNTFNLVRVPQRRSGYPSMDMLQGSTAGTIIANHNDPGAGNGNQSLVYIDSPPGGGAFSEVGGPPALGGGDEPIWPDVAGAADGSVVLSASRSTANTSWWSRTSDFITWNSWAAITPVASAGLPIKANANGHVACVLNSSFAGNTGIYIFESTNNGISWPGAATLLVPNPRIAPPDTFNYTLGSDLVYNGNNIYVVFAELNADVSVPTDSAQITFWSQATGFVVAASKRNTPGVAAFENLPTLNTITMDMPSIGMSGSSIVVAYHAMMQNDTSSNGYNCCDIFLVHSEDGGLTWSNPRNVSQSRGLDDRFVSVSPWNPPGYADLVWQEDTQAGGNIIGDPNATVNLTRQVFLRTALTGVSEPPTLPMSFSLKQNYPNPFNPATTIDYTVAQAGRVTIKVYDLLGKEVATALNEVKQPGSYQVGFSGTNLPSGVYVYQMRVGSFSESKKMVVLK